MAAVRSFNCHYCTMNPIETSILTVCNARCLEGQMFVNVSCSLSQDFLSGFIHALAETAGNTIIGGMEIVAEVSYPAQCLSEQGWLYTLYNFIWERVQTCNE